MFGVFLNHSGYTRNEASQLLHTVYFLMIRKTQLKHFLTKELASLKMFHLKVCYCAYFKNSTI